jgi:hypothetical protein
MPQAAPDSATSRGAAFIAGACSAAAAATGEVTGFGTDPAEGTGGDGCPAATEFITADEPAEERRAGTAAGSSAVAAEGATWLRSGTEPEGSAWLPSGATASLVPEGVSDAPRRCRGAGTVASVGPEADPPRADGAGPAPEPPGEPTESAGGPTDVLTGEDPPRGPTREFARPVDGELVVEGDGEDDEESVFGPAEPPEPVLSANATGMDATAEPIPSARASAPTRPT